MSLDDYRPGKVIPYFAVRMQLKEVKTPQPLIQQVEFTGVTPKTFISLSREPIAEGRHKYTPIKVGAKHTPDNYEASIISYSGMMY